MAHQSVFQNHRERRSYQRIDVHRRCHSTAPEGDCAQKINLTCIEQPSEENHKGGVDRPNHFALIHRRDVVYLHAYIPCGAWTIENRHFHVLCVHQRIGLLVLPYSQIGGCHLREGSQSRLEIAFVALQLVFKVVGKRHVAQCGNKDGLRLCLRIGRHGVRQLVYIAKQTSLQQGVLHIVSRERRHIATAEVVILLHLVGLQPDAEYLSSFASFNGLNRSAHGRCEPHLRKVLIYKQGITHVYTVSFVHNEFRNNAFEGVGTHHIFCACAYNAFRLGCCSFQVNV